MSRKQGSSIGAAFPLRAHRIAWLLMTCAALKCSGAIATTDGEAELARSPLPHEKIGSGRDQIKVNWFRYQEYFDGVVGHAAMLEELKANVQSCIRAAQLTGRVTRPPKVWPDYVKSSQRNTYSAANRSIEYGTSLLYTVNPADCSLTEHRSDTATLHSTKGFCAIDLTEKAAHGACDARAHADAPTVMHIGPDAPASGERPNAAMQTAMAALSKARQQYGGVKTGEHKTLAGIECDVFERALGTNGTTCVAHLASLKGPGASDSDVTLELSSVGGLNSIAVKAGLNATVNEAVFSPYLASGFQVSNVVRRK